MDHSFGPGSGGEEPHQNILEAAGIRLKQLYLRFGVWLAAGAALVLAIGLTVLYTSLATAERADGEGGTDESAAARIESSSQLPGKADSDPGASLRGSLRTALRRGLEVVSPGREGER